MAAAGQTSRASDTGPVKALLRGVLALLNDPKYFWQLASLLIIGDAVLTQLIIRLISCASCSCWCITCH